MKSMGMDNKKRGKVRLEAGTTYLPLGGFWKPRREKVAAKAPEPERAVKKP